MSWRNIDSQRLRNEYLGTSGHSIAQYSSGCSGDESALYLYNHYESASRDPRWNQLFDPRQLSPPYYVLASSVDAGIHNSSFFHGCSSLYDAGLQPVGLHNNELLVGIGSSQPTQNAALYTEETNNDSIGEATPGSGVLNIVQNNLLQSSPSVPAASNSSQTESQEGNSPASSITSGYSNMTSGETSPTCNKRAIPRLPPSILDGSGPCRGKHDKERHWCNMKPCTSSFVRLSDLKRHQADVHRRGQKIYRCDRCGYAKQTRKDKMMEHVRKKDHGGFTEIDASVSGADEIVISPVRR